MAIQFHLDEHLAPTIARMLRAQGLDVSTSQEAELLGQADLDQLAFAVSQGRALVTCDDGFLRDDFVEKARFGICYCHPRKYLIGELIEALQLVAECLSEEEMKNHIEYL